MARTPQRPEPTHLDKTSGLCILSIHSCTITIHVHLCLSQHPYLASLQTNFASSVLQPEHPVFAGPRRSSVLVRSFRSRSLPAAPTLRRTEEADPQTLEEQLHRKAGYFATRRASALSFTCISVILLFSSNNTARSLPCPPPPHHHHHHGTRPALWGIFARSSMSGMHHGLGHRCGKDSIHVLYSELLPLIRSAASATPRAQ